MHQTLSIDFSEPLPLFPLPNCVLLPHASIPLHIFEPRYRAMVHDALAGRRLIAMAVFAGDTWKSEYEGRPPIRPYVCLGYVIRHEALPDNHYNLLLQGVCRARVMEEVPHSPYRLALLQPTEHNPLLEIDLSTERSTIVDLLNDPLLRQLASVSAIHNWFSDEIPTAALVDLTIMTVCEDPEQRYTMLQEGNLLTRTCWLLRILREIRRTLRLAQNLPPQTDTDGICLN